MTKFPIRFLCLILPYFLCANEPSFEIIPNKALIPLLNPARLEQKIEKIQLSNGLQAVLVSDPDVKQSAVALTVLAGSWQDPDEFPGLAHFLEHMLFMGTSEYPEESSFTRFLTEHGGQTNAFTHGDYTSYMFALNTDGFKEAMKRFSSFFKTPLFNPSGVSRELGAIDQEFAQGFNNEDVRQYHVLKQLANPLHPFARFQTGNSTSLAKATTADLKRWYEDHYSANLMRLYVLSSESLEELQELVVNYFSGIQNHNMARFSQQTPLFKKEAYGSLVRILPKNATQTLTLIWEIPLELPPMIENRPADLICTALGYEGTNSLASILKQEGLADSLACYPIDIASLTYLFEIEIKLTSKGVNEYQTVIERVFQALHLIEEKPFPEYLFEDYSSMLKQRYQFEQRQEPFDFAMNQAPMLALEPIATYPELTKTLKTLDQAAIRTLLDSLSPEKAVYVLTAPAQKLSKKEPWMQISYDVEPVSQEILKNWANSKLNPAIALPPKNPFLARSLTPTKTLIDKNTYPALASPTPLLETAFGKVYYIPDPFYQVPRTSLLLQIQSAEIKDGKPSSVVMTELYIKALKDHLRNLIDEAQMADLDVAIERGLGSIQISLDGFTESLLAFFPVLAPKLTQFEITPQKFELFKEALSREYENSIKSSPIKQALDRFKMAILERYTTFNQKRNAIKKISYSDFQEFQKSLFKQTYLKGVVAGSATKLEAKNLIEQLENTLPQQSNAQGRAYYPKIKDFNNQEGPFIFNSSTSADGDALVLVLEATPYSPRSRNIQEMLSQTMSEAFFAELRTNQQTGYIVISDSADIQKHLFTFFGVQSTIYTPNELLWRFELFIETYLKQLHDQIPPSRFESLKSAMKKILKTPPATLKSFAEQNFKLGFEAEDFNWIVKRLDDLESLTYDDFIHSSKSFLSRENKRRLALIINGQTQGTRFEYRPMKVPKLDNRRSLAK